MMRLVKKSAYIGLGLAAMSAAALEQLGGKIAKEANLSEAEGKKLVEDMIEQSKKSREEMMMMWEQTMRDYMTKMNLATHEDVQSIEQRLARIETLLNRNNGKTGANLKKNKAV